MALSASTYGKYCNKSIHSRLPTIPSAGVRYCGLWRNQYPVPKVPTRQEGVMGILSWVILGLIAGVLAKWILPGAQPGGIIITIIVGIVGGVLGGYIGTHLGLGTVHGFDLRSLLLAVGGAVVLLLLYQMLSSR